MKRKIMALLVASAAMLGLGVATAIPASAATSNVNLAEKASSDIVGGSWTYSGWVNETVTLLPNGTTVVHPNSVNVFRQFVLGSPAGQTGTFQMQMTVNGLQKGFWSRPFSRSGSGLGTFTVPNPGDFVKGQVKYNVKLIITAAPDIAWTVSA